MSDVNNKKIKIRRLNFKTVKALVLCTFICISSLLFGCRKIIVTTSLSDNELIRVNKSALTLGEGKVLLAYEAAAYALNYGEDIFDVVTDDSYLKDEVLDKVADDLIILRKVRILAEAEGISLSNSDKENLKSAAKSFYNELTIKIVTELGISVADVYNLYEDFYYAQSYYESITDDVNVSISYDEARVIKVYSIFVAIDTDTDKTEAYEKISTAYSLVTGGTDFTTVARRYSDDETLTYQFARGEMVSEYEEAAFSLIAGEVSEIIETDDGYYIIKCVSDYVESATLTNKENIENEYKRSAFLEETKDALDSYISQINEDLLESLDVTAYFEDPDYLYECYENAR